MAKVAVLTGGSTPERDVALAGAGQVVSALRDGGHEVCVVDTCSGPLDAAAESEKLGASVAAGPPSARELRRLADREDILAAVRSESLRKAEAVFLVLHGRQGEGGQLQALLELEGLAFTGSDSLGSSVAMDKDLAKVLLRQADVDTPDWAVWPCGPERARELGFPLVVKPSRVGSTVGLSLVDDETGLDAAIGHALTYDASVLLESFVSGRELTVGVLGETALGVGEIVAPGQVFDFEAKYTPGMATEIFPAEIDSALESRLQELALRAHRALRLRDYSRVDFRLDANGRPLCLEANTLPGMTQTSLLPQSAACCGIDFQELCLRMLGAALERSR